MHCAGRGGHPPVSLAEVNFGGHANLAFYDVSLVDGYNVPISFGPVNTPSNGFSCGTPACTRDLLPTCPEQLRVTVGVQTVRSILVCSMEVEWLHV